MSVFDASVNLYRKTVKRLRPLHVVIHWGFTRLLIPLLEKLQGFKTVPDDPFWFRLELLIQRHERETTHHLDTLVKPGMVLLDIGAHVGYYSRRFARRVGESGKVFAFEPHPRTFALLSSNIVRYKNVTPVRAAVAETAGTAELYDYLIMSASGSLHYDESLLDLQKSTIGNADIAPRIAGDFPVQKFQVETLVLDEYLPAQGIEQVDIVKIDIEGAEIGALRGMQKTIHRSPALIVIMEYNPHALKAFDFDPAQALAEVEGLGFNHVQVIEKNGVLTNITGNPTAVNDLTARLMTHMGVVNLVFTRGY